MKLTGGPSKRGLDIRMVKGIAGLTKQPWKEAVKKPIKSAVEYKRNASSDGGFSSIATNKAFEFVKSANRIRSLAGKMRKNAKEEARKKASGKK